MAPALTLSRFHAAAARRWRRARYLWRVEVEFVRLEWKQSRGHAIGWHYRLWCWWNGFHTFRAPLYRLNDPAAGPLYVRDRELYRNTDLDMPLSPLLDNKIALWGLLRSRTAHAAPVDGLIMRGRYFPLDGGGSGVPVAELVSGWRGTYYLKQPGGSGGVDMLYVVCREGECRVNGALMAQSALAAQLRRRNYLVSPAIAQAAYAQAIQPATSNTVRLLTVFDDETGQAYVVAAAHSFGGAGGPTPLDSWYRGGAVCDVDLETGTLGPAVLFPRDTVRREQATHPETGAQIEGVQIPRWAEIRAEVERVATGLGFIPYIGWDVLVTDDSFFLLEGNARSALGLLQLQRPLLANPHFRRMLQRRDRLPRRMLQRRDRLPRRMRV